MSDVPLDNKTLAALIAQNRLVAVTDVEGQIVGYFAPALSREEMARRHLGLPDPEIVRAQREKPEKTYTTADVKAYLGSLESRG
ncbi:hypothetical protein J8F10_28010 [Gemmata sp. G18]|uniref:CBS domain-containing protein n=1 Tax=Gemmata palustris TaxID=2822762 RepID=A0ABS5BZH9_9BACT|nr:hypothetical protein [Gemmata palustris]MBP3959108.1 hypothetical protein [Gemmata palustris]